MPSTVVATRRGWIGSRRREVVEAVQRALLEGLRIPDTDRCVRLDEYDDDAFIAPPAAGPHYTVVEIILFVARPDGFASASSSSALCRGSTEIGKVCRSSAQGRG